MWDCRYLWRFRQSHLINDMEILLADVFQFSTQRVDAVYIALPFAWLKPFSAEEKLMGIFSLSPSFSLRIENRSWNSSSVIWLKSYWTTCICANIAYCPYITSWSILTIVLCGEFNYLCSYFTTYFLKLFEIRLKFYKVWIWRIEDRTDNMRYQRGHKYTEKELQDYLRWSKLRSEERRVGKECRL